MFPWSRFIDELESSYCRSWQQNVKSWLYENSHYEISLTRIPLLSAYPPPGFSSEHELFHPRCSENNRTNERKRRGRNVARSLSPTREVRESFSLHGALAYCVWKTSFALTMSWFAPHQLLIYVSFQAIQTFISFFLSFFGRSGTWSPIITLRLWKITAQFINVRFPNSLQGRD
jgi:hypothetical protein